MTTSVSSSDIFEKFPQSGFRLRYVSLKLWEGMRKGSMASRREWFLCAHLYAQVGWLDSDFEFIQLETFD